MFPASRLTDLTATGDAITGPGAPTIVIVGLPASVMGDQVAGAACQGPIVVGSPKVLWEGRPATRVTSQVSGVNPATGAPVATVIGSGSPTVFVP